MQFKLDLLFVNALSAFVDVQDGRLIVVSKGVVQVVGDQARLSDCCVAHEHQFELWYLFTFLRFRSLVRNFFHNRLDSGIRFRFFLSSFFWSFIACWLGFRFVSTHLG